MKKYILGIALSIWFFPVYAEDTPWLNVTTTNAWIDSMIVTFGSEFNNTQGCSQTTKTAFIIRGATEAGKQVMVSSLLAAAVSGKQVKFRINGCGGGGYDYPLIERVRVAY